MTLDDYQQLTGIDVPASQGRRVEAMLTRSQAILEDRLGFTLDPALAESNLYTERGKAPAQGWDWWSLDGITLDDPDPVVGAYRLYDFNRKDQFLHLDPFSAIHAVKLVHNDITLYTFDVNDYRVQYGRDGWSKFIEPQYFRLVNLTLNLVLASETYGLSYQLAVDADWLWGPEDDLPRDLEFAWSEMATYYGNPKRDIKSESIGAHSYTKFDLRDQMGQDSLRPEDQKMNVDTIRRYAGPYGTAAEMPI